MFAEKWKNTPDQITFNLNKLPQDPPKLFDLAPNEEFVMRTYDESGYQFFLIYNNELRYLFWVLYGGSSNKGMVFRWSIVIGRYLV